MASTKVRTFLRTATFVRGYATSGGAEGGAKKFDHAASLQLWKRISLFVALPGVGICWVNAQIKEKEEHEHYVRPEFVPYEHLRIMNKPFPWGDGKHTLFHNRKNQPTPDGYDDEQ